MAVRISVALCTHNGSRFIAEQVESILSQSVVPDELVISDDGSTDDTIARIERLFAERSDAPDLRILANREPLGVTANFEQAIGACTGDIVILSDQDDRWHSDRVWLTLRAFGDDPDILLVHGDAQLVDAEGLPLGSTLFGAYSVDRAALAEVESGRAFEYFLRRNIVTGATTAFRSQLARLAAPFPSSWVHDEWLAIVAAATGRIVPLTDHLIDYRQHGANQIGAVKVGFAAKLSRLTAPGAIRNRRLLERARALSARYPAMPTTTPARLAAVSSKVAHEEARCALPISRIRRVAPVLREASTGRYREFGGGLQDVLRDLVQPLEPGR